jgi:hypothetical protein
MALNDMRSKVAGNSTPSLIVSQLQVYSRLLMVFQLDAACVFSRWPW